MKKDSSNTEVHTSQEKRTRAGRPTAYGDSASPSFVRTAAYRERSKSEGYVRVETLIPESVKKSVQDIADKEGVSYSQAAGALLEYGVQQYEGNTKEPAPAFFAANALTNIGGSLCASGASGSSAEHISTLLAAHRAKEEKAQQRTEDMESLRTNSPIAAFFRKRKGE